MAKKTFIENHTYCICDKKRDPETVTSNPDMHRYGTGSGSGRVKYFWPNLDPRLRLLKLIKLHTFFRKTSQESEEPYYAHL
jgi:hypothetical protein